MSDKMQLMTRLMQSWEQRDAEAFLDCLTDDIEYHYHVGTRPVVGKDKMRKFVRNYAARYDQKAWKVFNHAENGNLLLVEGEEHVLDTVQDRLIVQPFMQACEFRDGLICKLRDYYDSANLQSPDTATTAGATRA